MSDPPPPQANPSAPAITRLAPSPTGVLHLGNALSFIVNWAIARRMGWKVILRIEDLNFPRVQDGADRLAVDLLQWLGIDWDDGPIYQSTDTSPYHNALRALAERGLIYPCSATRKQIRDVMSAPNEGDQELRYPGINRPEKGHYEFGDDAPPLLDEDQVAWRLIVPDEWIEFEDQLYGHQRVNVQQEVGDFVVASKAGLPAYQLSVVVDDARQGVSHVVRGCDLISSTARQLLLYRFLNLQPLPTYHHLPLVYGSDGRRLAKRHGDTRLENYRDEGVNPERVVGLLAYWSRLTSEPTVMTALEFAQRLDPDRLRTDSVTFTREDDQWLLAK